LSSGQGRSFHAVYVILFNAETMLNLLVFFSHFHSNKASIAYLSGCFCCSLLINRLFLYWKLWRQALKLLFYQAKGSREIWVTCFVYEPARKKFFTGVLWSGLKGSLPGPSRYKDCAIFTTDDQVTSRPWDDGNKVRTWLFK
jgi:hypothetical protein